MSAPPSERDCPFGKPETTKRDCLFGKPEATKRDCPFGKPETIKRDCPFGKPETTERDCPFGEPETIEQDISAGGLKITADLENRMDEKDKKKGIHLLILTVLLSALFARAVSADENLDIRDWWHLIVNNTIVCDIEEYPACQNYGVNGIFDALSANYDANVKKINSRYLCIAGVITSMNSNGSSLELADITGGTQTVTVRSSKKEKQKQAAQFKVGDHVRVFGKAGVSKILKISVTLQLNAIEKTSQTENRSSEIFSFASGRSFDRRQSVKRSFSDGAIEFLIPGTWSAVEEEISGTGMSGRMYRLNEIQTEYKTEPEQAYVFFFDNETGLKNITDRDADPKDIEKAIIRNIMDKDLNEQKSVKTADGYKFTYYLGNYKDNTGKYHNVEFIFTELNTKGVMGILYVYNESDHKEDIIYLMRTIVKK